MGEFGNQFRKAREKKQLSLEDVSSVTKIGSRMLQAIEEERFDRLPGGIFNKGFIRAYARHLELDDQAAVNDYLACMRQAQIDALEIAPAAAAEKSRSPKPGTRFSQSGATSAQPQPPAQGEELPELHLPRAEDVRPRRNDFRNSGPEIPWRIFAIAAVVLVVAVVLWMRRSHRAHAAAAAPPPARAAESSPSTADFRNPPASLLPATAPRQTSTSAHPLLRPASTSATHALATAPAFPPTSEPTSAADNAADDNPATQPAGNRDGSAKGFRQSSPSPPDKSAGPFKLLIRASETSWISVLADGQPTGHETLIAPARTSVRASREIVVKVGNAAGVTFLWNGREIPAAGAEGEVKTYLFDSSGMRIVPATPPAAQ